MKTTNYESIATNVAERLNEKFGEKIFYVTSCDENHCLIQNLVYDYEGNDVGIMITDQEIEGSITGVTVQFSCVDDLIDRIDELFVKADEKKL